jgi:hypothetical protein
MDRRKALKVLGTSSLAAAVSLEEAVAQQRAAAPVAPAQLAGRARAIGGVAYEPQFFTAHEWQTVRILVDMIIPADGRSGSAADAGVPEFMDFTMMDRPAARLPMRGGLAWLDAECGRRFDGRDFVTCNDAERRTVLDDIAWPKRARPELSHGTAWFTSFRDLTASGFWSSEPGVKDLEYRGNTFNPSWQGCPPEVLQRLGIRGRDG